MHPVWRSYFLSIQRTIADSLDLQQTARHLQCRMLLLQGDKVPRLCFAKAPNIRLVQALQDQNGPSCYPYAHRTTKSRHRLYLSNMEVYTRLEGCYRHRSWEMLLRLQILLCCPWQDRI